jgi:hypothetical protein
MPVWLIVLPVCPSCEQALGPDTVRLIASSVLCSQGLPPLAPRDKIELVRSVPGCVLPRPWLVAVLP